MKFKTALLTAVIICSMCQPVFADYTARDTSVYESRLKAKPDLASQTYGYMFTKNMSKSDAPSYLYVNSDGTYTAITVSDRLYLQVMDKDFEPVSYQDFKLINPIFGGYYFDGKDHYVVTAKKKNSSTFTYTIDKYNSKFSNSQSVSIDYITSEVFKDGGAKITVKGGQILVSDTTDKANVVLSSDSDKLKKVTITEYNKQSNPKKKVNNSDYFTYINNDENLVQCYKTPTGIYIKGKESDNENEEDITVDMIEIYNTNSEIVNDSFTLDDFAATKNKYILTGTKVSQDRNFSKNKDFNIFVSAMNSTQFDQQYVNTTKLTSYSEKDGVSFSNIHLVKLDDERCIVCWQETKAGDKTAKYAVLDKNGTPVSDVSVDGAEFSNCAPVVKGNKLVWFNIEDTGAEPVFYSVDIVE